MASIASSVDDIPGGMYESDEDDLESKAESSTSPFKQFYGDGEVQPGGTYVAELGLLHALNKDRDYHRVEKPGRQLNQISIMRDENGEVRSPEAFKEFRTDKEAEAYRITQAELDEVKTLHHQGLKAGVSSDDGAKIKKLQETRKVRHDRAVYHFQEERKDVYLDIESRVLTAAQDVKDDIEAIENKVAAVFAELNNDAHLVQQDEQYVLDKWTELEGICATRAERVTAFETELDEMEQYRATRIGDRLAGLVEELVAIAYDLPPLIERLAETEAYDVNMVIIANRRDFADVIARMRMDDIKYKHAQRARWERRRVAWRHLKHNRALKQFDDLLNSGHFVNPGARQDIVEQLRASQRQRHDGQRLPAIKSLAKIVPPKLRSKDVAAVKSKLETIDAEEREAAKAWYEKLEIQRDAAVDAALGELERLRAELHSYGALSPEGEFLPAKARMEPLIRGEEIEDFFIRSGGLKNEMNVIFSACGTDTLIYNDDLSRLQDRAEFVACGMDFHTLLEEQGKSDARKAMQDTLERMRTAKKNDLPNLLPAFTKQLTALTNVTGMPDRLKMEMESCLTTATDIMAEIASYGGTVGGGSKAGGTVRTGSKGGTVRSKTRSVRSKTKSVASRAGTRRPGTAASVSSVASSSGVAALINVGEVRVVQRRVGSLVYACELGDDLKQVIRDIVHACDLQATANDIVDQVLASQCSPVIEQRGVEYNKLMRRMAIAMEQQATHLHMVGERVCAFYAAVAKASEAQHKLEADIDENFEDDLNGALDDYEDADAARESKLERALNRLRWAPDEVSLERNLEAANHSLDNIENGYRQYHAQATGIADKHPVAIADNIRSYRRDMCASFHLVFPKAEEVDGLDAAEAEARRKAEEAKQAAEKEAADKAAGADADDGSETGSKPPESARSKKSSASQAEAAAEPGEPAAPEPVVEEQKEELNWEELPVFATKGNTEYRMVKTERDMAELMVAESEEESDEEEPVPAVGAEGADAAEGVEAAAGAGAGAGAGIDAADAEAQGSEFGDGKSQDELAAAEEEEEKEEGMPKDPDGNDTVETVLVKPALLAAIIKQLRQTMFDEWDARTKKRRQANEVLHKTRVEDLTDELEERLRRHWPRKGHAEVKVKQPREAELIAHKQRQQRHARNILARNKVHDKQFDKLLQEAHEDLAKFKARQAALARSLPSRTNLAALQGVLQKAKTFRAHFKEECEAWHARLGAFVNQEPKKLLQGNQDFLRSCKLFTHGGEYAKEEVAICQRALEGVEKELDADLDRRNAGKEELQKAQEDALEAFAAFQDDFDRSLQDLSMREGLGKKYGGPRRNAQERLRTEMAWSDAAEAAIGATLDRLEEVQSWEAGSHSQDMEGCISLQLVCLLTKVQHLTHKRANFLEAFKDGVREFDLSQVPLTDVPGEKDDEMAVTIAGAAGTGAGGNALGEMTEEEKAAAEKEAAHTFSGAMQDLKRRCEEETIALYEAEGKELPNGEMPEALQIYLTEQLAKADKFREMSARKFREQIERLQVLLLATPEAALSDCMARSQGQGAHDISVQQGRFDRMLAAFKKVLKQHKKMLKPQLADPNEYQALQNLCEMETKRCAEVRETIVKFRGLLLEAVKQTATVFEARILFYTRNLLKLIDNQIMRADLAPLPGDELIVAERMSLKRLKKSLHKRDAEKAANPDADVVIGPATMVLRPRVWPGIAMGQFVEPEPPAWLKELNGAGEEEKKEEAEPEPAAKGKKGAKAKAAPKKGKAAPAAAEPEAAEETKVEMSPEESSFYTPATRHAIRSREENHAAFVAWYNATTSDIDNSCTELWNGTNDWQNNWNKMVAFLQQDA